MLLHGTWGLLGEEDRFYGQYPQGHSIVGVRYMEKLRGAGSLGGGDLDLFGCGERFGSGRR